MALLNRRGLAWLVRALWLCCGCSVSWAAPPSEYQVKAVFLFNFAQFVQWPTTAFSSPAAPFVIGVIGEDPFGRSLDDAVRGEKVNNHLFVVAHFQDPSQAANCNILFLGQMDPGRAANIVAAVKARSVLTVSDAGGSAVPGVAVVMVTQDGRIRLRIDLAAAKAAGLQISSQLLQAATVVDGGG